MIKKLRWQIIGITMISVFFVLAIIIIAINITNFNNVKSSNDDVIETISNNGGVLESNTNTPDADSFFENFSPNRSFFSMDDYIRDFESAYDTRYFTVTFNSNGTITDVNIDNVAAITSEQAVEYAELLIKKGKDEGLIGSYNYRLVEIDNENMYIFVDCSKELTTFYDSLITSIVISICGMALVFVLAYFLSKIIVKPVETSIKNQKQFITDASHELKTPLTIIDANTEIIEMEAGESEWTESNKKQIDRLTDLTNKLVMLTRMDEKENSYEFVKFNLSDLCNDICFSFESVAKKKEKIFTYNVETGIEFNGDESAINQMISSLFENAFKYSNDGGEINFTLKRKDKKIKIILENTVDSITPGNHNELFERFYRSDSSRNSKVGGSGLGLSIVNAIVTGHKGKVNCVSEDEHSIKFEVTLNQ